MALATLREAYSRLPFLLEERGLTADELRARLAEEGERVGPQTLTRLLDSDRPVRSLELRAADALCRVLDSELSELLAFITPLTAHLRRLPRGKQRRLDALMARHTEEGLTGADLAELTRLVDAVDEIGLFNTQRLVEHRARVRAGGEARGHSAAD